MFIFINFKSFELWILSGCFKIKCKVFVELMGCHHERPVFTQLSVYYRNKISPMQVNSAHKQLNLHYGTFNHKEGTASNFSWQDNPWIKM